jgi:two-component system sensor histidine kinase KdpD
MTTGAAEQPTSPRRSAGTWSPAVYCALVQHAARAIEADRGRTALLAAVSHDLRAPLAAAKAAVSGLRSRDARLTANDREELLAIAEESLDLLGHLASSLLDVSRLQAGALAVFPRPSDLGEVVAASLDALGPQARAVLADIPPRLRAVMTDPAILERVVANLVGNALRYSPAGSPPLVTAKALGDRVELRVVDHGPGIPEASRKRAFMPFQRLGELGYGTSVGLGLTVSRGLAEAMGGTVESEETPGGGLTMCVSLPGRTTAYAGTTAGRLSTRPSPRRRGSAGAGSRGSAAGQPATRAR